MGSFARQRTAKLRKSETISWWDKLTPFLVRWRYVFFLATLAIVFLLELLEHLMIRFFDTRIHLYFDIIFFAIIMPVSMWVLLAMLERTESARARAEKAFDLRAEFGQSLGESGSWEDLVTRIVRFPCSVVKRTHAVLYVLNPITSVMEPEASCAPDGSVQLHPSIDLNPDSLPIGSLSQLLKQSNQANLFAHDQAAAGKLPAHRYDLSIARNDHQIGVIKLTFPENHPPTDEELRVLKTAAPMIALALEGAILQNVAATQAANSDLQRQQIAQNLHDTLAQNVGYLRLKLDQLTGENAIREIGVVLQELERMRSTADEAYQQVRNTLDALNPIMPEDLMTIINKQADIISKRAGFRLRTNQIGTPFHLPSPTRQQILYIAREALHNIEKHACARQANVQFLWLTSELILKITDDGVGFDPRSVTNDGHYGLWIMQHRAQEVGGTLKIAPVENGHGTEVTLWVPHNAYPLSNEI